MRDQDGKSVVIELINGDQIVYLDNNNGVDGFGVMTNEPTFDWHLENIRHYNWKRTLSRQVSHDNYYYYCYYNDNNNNKL